MEPLHKVYEEISKTVEHNDTQRGYVPGAKRLLTAREVQVLQCIADGKGIKGAADELGLSPLTVKSHLARIGGALRTGNRVLMMLQAMRAGLVK